MYPRVVVVKATFTDGSVAIVRCTEGEWATAVKLAESAVFNVMVTALYQGKIVRLNVLDVEGKRKRVQTLIGLNQKEKV